MKVLDRAAEMIRRVADQIAPTPAPTATAPAASQGNHYGPIVVETRKAGVFEALGNLDLSGFGRPNTPIVTDSRSARGADGRPASFGAVVPLEKTGSLDYGVNRRDRGQS